MIFDQNLQTETGCTAMFIACQNGHVDVVTCLANDMDSILLRNKAGWSPIHIAAAQGHTKVIQVVGSYFNLCHGFLNLTTEVLSKFYGHLQYPTSFKQDLLILMLTGIQIKFKDQYWKKGGKLIYYSCRHQC